MNHMIEAIVCESYQVIYPDHSLNNRNNNLMLTHNLLHCIFYKKKYLQGFYKKEYDY